MEKKERGPVAHFLLLPYPSQGHINPMLQFGKRLASKGLKATLATTLFIINSSGAGAKSGSIQIEAISDGYDEGGRANAGSSEEYIERFKDMGSRTLGELIERLAASDDPLCCLVYDAGLTWALDVAAALGITAAAFFSQTCAVFSIYHCVCEQQRTVPVAKPCVSPPELPPLEIPDLPVYVSKLTSSTPFIVWLIVNLFSNIEKANMILFNTFDKLEPEVVDWLARLYPVKTIGPTVPSVYLDKRVPDDSDYSLNLYKPNSEACMNWLDQRCNGSVLYVSFGSVAVLGAEQMVEMACALQSSSHPFLWVVRASEEDKLPEKFVEETAEKGLIVTWCPQLEVLAHRALGCFITHGGWNSTTEALSLGVPMVVMPASQWSDQMVNAKYVEDVWKVGVRATTDEKEIVRREEIELCLREVMEGSSAEEMRRNASKWKELSKEAVDEGGSSDKNIQEFVRSFVENLN